MAGTDCREFTIVRILRSVFCGGILMFSLLVISAGCGNRKTAEDEWQDDPASQTHTAVSANKPLSSEKEDHKEMTMQVQVGGSTFPAVLEENAAVDALVEMMEQGPVTVEMRDYAGFEKVGSLDRSLPTDNQQITTRSGDIVLYQGNQIVMFYGSNSWSYTRLAHIHELDGWEEALGSGAVTVTFSLEN